MPGGGVVAIGNFIAKMAGVIGTAEVRGVPVHVKEDGSIDGQCLDYGQMTPVLTAAIKGLIDKVETLESEVAALKGS